MNHFDKFAPETKAALQAAQTEAKNMKLPYIGTEHLLLGILSQKKSLGCQLLADLGVSREAILTILKTTPSHQVPPSQVIKKGLSELAKKNLENAVAVAKKYNHALVGTEHLLYAIIEQHETAAVVLLESLNVDLEGLRRQLENIFMNTSQSQSEEGGPAGNIQDPFDLLFGNLMGDLFDKGFPKRGRSATLQRRMQENPVGVETQERPKETPALNYFTIDLTGLAMQGKLDPVIGRKDEIQRVISILNRRTKNNPVITGEAGVGKTAIAEGIAQRISADDVPSNLIDKRVLRLDMASVVAGTKYRGEFEERIKSIIEEAKAQGNILLFIDEIHTVIGAGSSEGSLDAANILKPALSRGEIQIIGATTTDEYRKHIENDPALERRFQPVMVDEPSKEDTIKIIEGLRPLFEEHHTLKITDEAIDAAVTMSKRYIGDRFLPDKAIDLIDEAASLKGMKSHVTTDKTKKVRNSITKIIQEKESAVANQDYERATALRDKELELIQQLEKINREQNKKQKGKEVKIQPDDIASVIAAMTGIPAQSLVKSEMERLKGLDKILKKHVIGQDEAVEEIAKAIRRSRTGVTNINRPIGTFIFLGPTGVGKTELTKQLAKQVYCDENALIRIDMSEFMERHNVSRLIGTTAGYVGYEEGGQLTEAIRRKPYSVLLFDEIEKAHPDVFNLLLQILEDGILTDGQGRRVDFRNTIIIMTSNIGSRKLTEEASSIGFDTGNVSSTQEQRYENLKNNVLDELKKSFRPEFINRIDKIICFKPLTQDVLKDIVKLQLSELEERVKDKNLTLEATPKAVDKVFELGHDPHFGARPIRRTIQDQIENQISELILEGKVKNGDHVKIDVKEDKIVCSKKPVRRSSTSEGGRTATKKKAATKKAVTKKPKKK